MMMKDNHINQLDKNIITEITSLLKNLNGMNGMTRTSCEMHLKSFIDLKRNRKNAIIIDPKSDWYIQVANSIQ